MTSLPWIQPRLLYGVGLGLGLQGSTDLQLSPWHHMGSNLVVLVLYEIVMKSTFKWIRPHVHNLPESATIHSFIQRSIVSTVRSLLCAFIDDLENILWLNDIIMIRNYGEDQEVLEERRGGTQVQQSHPNQVGGPIQVKLESNSDPRSMPHQNHRPDHIRTPF
jgi:hypothetical protein